MISLYKKRGETPLQALARLRSEQPELATETLSYAGRLDPMAEGVMPVLVGSEENRNRKEFLQKDKEYEAHFLIGCATDTHDILGLISRADFQKTNTNTIVHAVEDLKNITNQTYPWFSSRTVDGVPLFEHARNGNFDIERPIREVEVYAVSDILVYELDAKKLVLKNIEDIASVVGDFRQEESIALWKNILETVPQNVWIVSCVLKVSSGTYIRSMTENLGEDLGVPVLLQKLVRTQVF